MGVFWKFNKIYMKNVLQRIKCFLGYHKLVISYDEYICTKWGRLLREWEI